MTDWRDRKDRTVSPERPWMSKKGGKDEDSDSDNDNEGLLGFEGGGTPFDASVKCAMDFYKHDGFP